MNNNVHRYQKSDISGLTGKSILFDANILIYIFWPVPGNTWRNQYSTIFSRLFKQHNKLVINTFIISEIINRVIRIEHENYKSTTGSSLEYKKYRDSADGQSALNEIYRIILNKILPCFDVYDKSFNKTDLQGLLQADTLDFTDKIILNLCKENDFILLTNDADFRNTDINILTANRKLLGA